MVNEELEKIKEKFKLNFFQIEKLLSVYDERLKVIEDEIKSKSNFEKKIKGELEDLKQGSVDLSKSIENLHKGKAGLNEEELTEKILAVSKEKGDEYFKKINDFFKNSEKESRELKDWIRGLVDEKMVGLTTIIEKFPKIEEQVSDFEEKFEGWKVLGNELENDKALYIELRKVVLASVEKLNTLEGDFRKNIENIGEIYTRLEEAERSQEKLSEELRIELKKLDGKRDQIEQDFQNFKIGTEKSLESKFQEVDLNLEKEIKEKLLMHGKTLNEFGEKFLSIEGQINSVKSEGVKRFMDEEFNKFIVVLNDKVKDLVTTQEFDKIKCELREKVEHIRKPELKPMEDRIKAIEDDAEELKKMIRGISLRLPVVIE